MHLVGFIKKKCKDKILSEMCVVFRVHWTQHQTYNFPWYGAEIKIADFLGVIRKGFCVWPGTKSDLQILLLPLLTSNAVSVE